MTASFRRRAAALTLAAVTAWPAHAVRYEGQDFADTLTLRSNAVAVFTDVTSNKPAGLRYPPTGSDSPGRLVFLPFPFDAVSATATAPDNRATLMRNVVPAALTTFSSIMMLPRSFAP